MWEWPDSISQLEKGPKPGLDSLSTEVRLRSVKVPPEIDLGGLFSSPASRSPTSRGCPWEEVCDSDEQGGRNSLFLEHFLGSH